MAFSVDIANQNIGPVPPATPVNTLATAPTAVPQQSSEQGTSDLVGAVVTGGTQDGVTASYNAVTREVSLANTDKGSTAVATHTALPDPHPQYAVDGHTHVPADVVGLSEAIDDRVAALLVAGPNVTLTYDDVANTLTVEATGGGGGGGGSDPWTYRSLGADHANSTLVTTVIPTIQVSPSSAGTWIVEGMLLLSTANTATMPRLTTYMPDNAVGSANITIQHGGTTELLANNGTGASGNFTAAGAAYATTGLLAQVSACFVSTGAATVAFRIGLVSETDTVAVTCIAGSWLRYRKVGAGGGGGGGGLGADDILAIGALT